MELLLNADSELQIAIRQQLNEDVNTRDSYVEIIKEWLHQQPHLPDTWDDDVQLLNFLRGCGFSLEKCKKKFDLYFTMRTAVPEIFSNRTFKNAQFQKMSTLMYNIPLPTLTNRGYRATIIRFKYKNKMAKIEEAMKLHFMILDSRLLLEETGVAGDVYILDCETLSSLHVSQLTPALIKKLLICAFEVYPLKVKEIHVINCHPFVNIVYAMLKPFMKKKIINRMHFHSDGIESLYKFVPKKILPEEYGGSAGKLQQFHDLWMKKLEECEEWFIEQDNFKSDESKRPGKPINYGALFGVEGSFKQLNVE